MFAIVENNRVLSMSDENTFNENENIQELTGITLEDVHDGYHIEVDNILHVYKKISITSDKIKINSDGVDYATITANVNDFNSNEIIKFYVNGELVSSDNSVNGIDTIQINATSIGNILVEAESTTNYGRNSIVIEVV